MDASGNLYGTTQGVAGTDVTPSGGTVSDAGKVGDLLNVISNAENSAL
jgi:hypothetical protein